MLANIQEKTLCNRTGLVTFMSIPDDERYIRRYCNHTIRSIKHTLAEIEKTKSALQGLLSHEKEEVKQKLSVSYWKKRMILSVAYLSED